MWQEAKSNEKRIKEVMADHKKRAERRRAYYNSKLGDPRQLLRIIGSTIKLYPNGEQYYYHENTNNLMPWQGDTTVKIDRFDGRSLLDSTPQNNIDNTATLDDEDFSDREELNFERYRDLVETDRLHQTEKERLELVDEEWTKLLDRHKALLAMINPTKKKSNAIGFDYGTSTTSTIDYSTKDQESDLLNETDILKYVNDLTEKDRDILNDMGRKYGIRNYVRLLRVAKRDRDEELNQLKAKQTNGNNKSEGGKSRRKKRRRRARRDQETGESTRRQRRSSPSYGEGYSDEDSDSDATDDDDYGSSADDNSDFVIEFGSNSGSDGHQHRNEDGLSKSRRNTTPTITSRNSSSNSAPPVQGMEKKLTPMEKLKMKMRAGLEKTIQSDANAKLQKEQERQLEGIQQHMDDFDTAKGIAPIISSMNVTGSNTDEKHTSTRTRYRSPSSSRSPSPTKRSSSLSSTSKQSRTSSNTTKRYHHSPVRRDRSDRRVDDDRSPSRHRSPSPTKDRHHYRHDARSRSSRYSNESSRYRSSRRHRAYSRSRSRSRSRSPSPSSRHRHRSSSSSSNRKADKNRSSYYKKY
ncbi:alternative splicing regulator-domain-containing protein [Halteromyces radiatus]|uniref:alternative splicing regulator-domain-containing protein n=1 Tax=Halteromyces radiatus TaxID=101107 RepID=UPI002220CDB3|nr:alternative splicing regulator-domain-containing protein [Halteromyces radiatus]KAI8084575.1 alternative splicing regulator-domain-containing protein [Halteromyces radiatus]